VGKVDKIKAKVPKVRPPGLKRPIVLRTRPQATNSAEPEYSVEAILGEKKEGNHRLYEDIAQSAEQSAR